MTTPYGMINEVKVTLREVEKRLYGYNFNKNNI